MTTDRAVGEYLGDCIDARIASRPRVLLHRIYDKLLQPKQAVLVIKDKLTQQFVWHVCCMRKLLSCRRNRPGAHERMYMWFRSRVGRAGGGGSRSGSRSLVPVPVPFRSFFEGTGNTG